VFGRIAPDQKSEIVDRLRTDAHYVAMIGDGVNDVPAMKRAHLAIAMRAGTAVTRGIADMILLDDSFAALPAAFSEGRRIRAGMATVVRLFLARTIAVMLIILAAALATSEFPLTPRHTALQSALTVGIPAFFIATWTRPADTGKYLIPSALRFVIPAGVTMAVAGAVVYEAALRLTDVESSRTVLALATVFAGATLIPFVDDEPAEWMTLRGFASPVRTALLAGVMLATALAVALSPLREFYELEPLGLAGWGAVLLTVALWALALAAAWRALDALLPRLGVRRPDSPGAGRPGAADAPVTGER
jgi:cation-transporting ATPase E